MTIIHISNWEDNTQEASPQVMIQTIIECMVLVKYKNHIDMNYCDLHK